MELYQIAPTELLVKKSNREKHARYKERCLKAKGRHLKILKGMHKTWMSEYHLKPMQSLETWGQFSCLVVRPTNPKAPGVLQIKIPLSVTEVYKSILWVNTHTQAPKFKQLSLRGHSFPNTAGSGEKEALLHSSYLTPIRPWSTIKVNHFPNSSLKKSTLSF